MTKDQRPRELNKKAIKFNKKKIPKTNLQVQSNPRRSPTRRSARMQYPIFQVNIYTHANIKLWKDEKVDFEPYRMEDEEKAERVFVKSLVKAFAIQKKKGIDE